MIERNNNANHSAKKGDEKQYVWGNGIKVKAKTKADISCRTSLIIAKTQSTFCDEFNELNEKFANSLSTKQRR